MNNSKVIEKFFEETKDENILVALRERATYLTEIIEALKNISSSSYWVVIKKEFDNELTNSRSRLEKEESTVEIFRLQGRIENAKKYDLARMLEVKLKELEYIKNKIKENEPNYGEL